MSRLLKAYEWDVEVVDASPDAGDDPDILDHHGAATFAEAQRYAAQSERGTVKRIVLVLDVGNDDEGMVDRAWAYLRADRTLPEFFGEPSAGMDYRSTGDRVPKRFHDEVARWYRTHADRRAEG